MKQLQFVKFRLGKVCLSENTSECTACNLSMLGYYSGDKTALQGSSELHMASGLSSLIESGFEKLAPELAVRDRLHAAISSSK